MGQLADGLSKIGRFFRTAADPVHPRIDSQVDLGHLVFLQGCCRKLLGHGKIIDRLGDVIVHKGLFMFFRHGPQNEDRRHDTSFAKLQGFLCHGHRQIIDACRQGCRCNGHGSVAIGISFDNRADFCPRFEDFARDLYVMGNGRQIDFGPNIPRSHKTPPFP